MLKFLLLLKWLIYLSSLLNHYFVNRFTEGYVIITLATAISVISYRILKPQYVNASPVSPHMMIKSPPKYIRLFPCPPFFRAYLDAPSL